jgi:hypothetical protein
MSASLIATARAPEHELHHAPGRAARESYGSGVRFIAGIVTVIAVIEAAIFASIPFLQAGALGEYTDGAEFLEPLTTTTYWLTALACLTAVAVLVNTVNTVSQYPRSTRSAILRTGSLVGFALINLSYFAFAVCVGLIADNPAMFGYSLHGMAAFGLAVALLRVRPRRVASSV